MSIAARQLASPIGVYAGGIHVYSPTSIPRCPHHARARRKRAARDEEGAGRQPAPEEGRDAADNARPRKAAVRRGARRVRRRRQAAPETARGASRRHRPCAAPVPRGSPPEAGRAAGGSAGSSGSGGRGARHGSCAARGRARSVRAPARHRVRGPRRGPVAGRAGPDGGDARRDGPRHRRAGAACRHDRRGGGGDGRRHGRAVAREGTGGRGASRRTPQVQTRAA